MNVRGTLISFDPGLREAGLAVFTDGCLSWATLVRNPNTKDRGGQAWQEMAGAAHGALLHVVGPVGGNYRFVSEIPQVYREGKSANVDPDDLTNLSGVVGALIGFLDPDGVKTYVPAKWKGQVPKEIHNKRIVTALSPEEKAVLDAVKCPASLKHNVIDAVGVGLYELGRLGGITSKLKG